jgi:hypothetical protein
MMYQSQYRLNAICPYFTMFPLDFPLGILQKRSEKEDIVLDPFCGRGTTNYASRISGLFSIGVDSSPVAVAIAEAKLANTTPERIIRAAEQILQKTSETAQPQGEFWEHAYHEKVLIDLCKFRTSLNEDCASDTRKGLRGIILGALHGPRKLSGSSYFSNQAQRTYAPKPDYAVKYWKKNNLKPEMVDVLGIIRERAERFYRQQLHARGRIIHGDSRLESTYEALLTQGQVSWIITSPPYYGMRTYIPDQWLRMWFLGGKSKVDYSSKEQLSHSSKEEFADDLRKVWNNLEKICSSNANLVIRFGAINDRKTNPAELIKTSLIQTNWTCKTIVSAGSAASGYRQAKHMTSLAGDALDEVDVWAKLN